MAEIYTIQEIGLGADIEGPYAAEQIKDFIEDAERITIDDLMVIDYEAFYPYEDCFKAEGVQVEIQWNVDSLFEGL